MGDSTASTQGISITIAVDDVHPQQGWGLPEDDCIAYMTALHEEFGAKFTFFVCSNYHTKYPISQYKDWIKWLQSNPWIELAAHGHYHLSNDPEKWGELEFYQPLSVKDYEHKVSEMLQEWANVNVKPVGWRSPGWLTHDNAKVALESHFEYAAVHNTHSAHLTWSCPTLKGHDGIHQHDLSLYNGVIMYQSHINGDWNDNQWTNDNYEVLRRNLQHLTSQYEVTFKLLKDLI